MVVVVHGGGICSKGSSPSAGVGFADRGLLFEGGASADDMHKTSLDVIQDEHVAFLVTWVVVLVTGHCGIKNENLESECNVRAFVHVAGHCGINNEHLESECNMRASVHVAGHLGDFLWMDCIWVFKDQCVCRVFQMEVIFSIVAASATMVKYHTFLRFRRDSRLSTAKLVGSMLREVMCAVISSAVIFFLVFNMYFAIGFLKGGGAVGLGAVDVEG